MKRSFGIVSRIVFVLVFGALLSLFASVEARANPVIRTEFGEGVATWSTDPANISNYVEGDVFHIIIVLENGYELDGDITISDFDSSGAPRSQTVVLDENNQGEFSVKLAQDAENYFPYAYIRVSTKKKPYHVTVNSGGHGSAVSDRATAGVNDQVTLTATPDPGYEFDRWETNSGITINTTDNPATFTMIAGPVSVRAKFKPTGNASSPSSGTTPTPAPRTRPGDDDDDDDHEDEPAPAPKPVDPNAVIGMSFAGNLTGNVKIGPQVQGLIAQRAFSMNTPKGWKEAFAFNMTINDKADYSLKKGTLSFRIPAQYQKAGRKYAILGIDRNGEVKVFDDIDLKPDTITVNLDIEGFAFDLIYCD